MLITMNNDINIANEKYNTVDGRHVAHCVQVKESNLQREEDTGVDEPAAEGNERTSTPHDSDVAQIQASRKQWIDRGLT